LPYGDKPWKSQFNDKQAGSPQEHVMEIWQESRSVAGRNEIDRAARVTGPLLAGALLALMWLQPTAGYARPAASFLSGNTETVATIEIGTKQVAEAFEPPATSIHRANALFGLETQLLTQGEVLNKWNHARAEIAQELQIVDRCRTSDVCPAAARRLIDLSAEGAGRNGRARVGLINRAVDYAISPASDEAQWRVPDHWSSPLETLQSGRGDCEDYAIVKYLALLEVGISEADLRIVLMKNVFPSEDHAVLAARVDGEWLILDSRTLTLVRDTDVKGAAPIFVLDNVGAWRVLPGGRTRRDGP
jgi:predicted transglutaminase-like cysteine proteinase